MNQKHFIILLMAFCPSLSICVSTRDTVRVNKVELVFNNKTYYDND